MRLKELREERNLSQLNVANAIGTSQTNIGRWEKDKNEPSSGYVVKLADFFEVTTDYLLGREDDFGNISVTTNLNLTAEEKVMLELFNQLPDVRRRTIIDTMRFMVDSNRSSATQNKISNVKK